MNIWIENYGNTLVMSIFNYDLSYNEHSINSPYLVRGLTKLYTGVNMIRKSHFYIRKGGVGNWVPLWLHPLADTRI